jgi:hypothetical protein
VRSGVGEETNAGRFLRRTRRRANKPRSGLLSGIDRVEESVAAERKRTGTRVIGRRRILAQDWKDSPASVEPRRVHRPRFAGGLDVRLLALADYRAFQYAYKQARKHWLAGLDALFPVGTYWLSRFAHVAVETN